MTPMAKPLSNTEMNDLAAFYAAQPAAPPQHQANAANAQAGPELAKKFNCTQCHGPRLLGQQQMPRLAGQHYEYQRAQLAAFKTGKRADLDGNMTAAAQALSDKDIEVLADYMAGLAPK
jgi:cytochrome c553